MSKAIGMLELQSIARGIETCDYMVKAAQVELLRAATICPGKYVIIVGGDTAGVRESLEAGKKQGGEYIVDSLLIPNVSDQLFPAISGSTEVKTRGAIGVVEYYSVTSAILAADLAVKAANVELIEIRMGFAIGGKGYFTITGDVGAVKAAVASAKANEELFVESVVIPRPSPQLFDSLC